MIAQWYSVPRYLDIGDNDSFGGFSITRVDHANYVRLSSLKVRYCSPEHPFSSTTSIAGTGKGSIAISTNREERVGQLSAPVWVKEADDSLPSNGKALSIVGAQGVENISATRLIAQAEIVSGEKDGAADG